MNKMPSLKDVSRHAGVSISTVSRYLSGELNVKKETEQRIQQAIQELGYRPNHVARALKTRSTKIVGVVVPSSTNPLFAEIVAGAYSVLSANGYTYIQTASENDIRRELECFQLLQHKQVDGLIVISSADAGEHYGEWIANGLIWKQPVVFVNRMFDESGNAYARVLNDFERGSYKAVEHFVKTGRRRIAMITGIPGLEESSVKERGYHQCLRDYGLETHENWVQAGCYRFEEGYAAAQYLLQNVMPDAILAANDLTAIAALSCANAAGLRVPEDLAVIGYGNSEASAFTYPALSTIDQQKHFSGQRSAQLLLDLLAGKPACSEIVKTDLILRRSC